MARQPARKSALELSAPPAPRTGDRESVKSFKETSPGELFWDLVTFDRLLTGPVIHIIYWAGLAILVLGGFATIGGAFGMALREEGWIGKLLTLPVAVGGLIMLTAGALIWRSFCEFFVAIFRISDDLKVMRAVMEAGGGLSPAPPARGRGKAAPDAGPDGGL